MRTVANNSNAELLQSLVDVTRLKKQIHFCNLIPQCHSHFFNTCREACEKYKENCCRLIYLLFRMSVYYEALASNLNTVTYAKML